MMSYRYPNERLILALTIILVLVVIVVTATATLCGSVVFVALMLALAYALNSVHHDALVKSARAVTPESLPRLERLVRECAARLRPGKTQTYIAPGRILNAYTFGLTEPRTVVVYAGMLQVMDEGELKFVMGHEMGHIALGHTWLNSLVGGMAGIPSPYGAAALLYFAFRWWNRACEYSADRAGLLACGQPDTAISALVKLTGRAAQSPEGLRQALLRLEAQDDDLGNVLGEMLSTHPMIVRRIHALRSYAASAEYRALQARLSSLSSLT
jgi:Zn-dependent protease with chaperone function